MQGLLRNLVVSDFGFGIYGFRVAGLRSPPKGICKGSMMGSLIEAPSKGICKCNMRSPAFRFWVVSGFSCPSGL